MGHYASEMDPNWGKNHSKAERISKLRLAFEKVPVSAFKAADIVYLTKLYSVDASAIPEFVLKRFEAIAKAAA